MERVHNDVCQDFLWSLIIIIKMNGSYPLTKHKLTALASTIHAHTHTHVHTHTHMHTCKHTHTYTHTHTHLYIDIHIIYGHRNGLPRILNKSHVYLASLSNHLHLIIKQ